MSRGPLRSSRPAETVTQSAMWEKPPRDETPIETGGAVVVVRLSPAESAVLLAFAATLHEAVHMLVSAAEQRGTP
jgi:hypothetical protein